MQPLPHQYHVTASAKGDDNIILHAEDLPELVSAPPAEFDGPGDRWSPEQLLIAALASCLVLSFRAIARSSNLEWDDLDCAVEGVLNEVDRKLCFTEFTFITTLTVPEESDREKAARLLEKAAEHGGLVSNSVAAKRNLVTSVKVRD